MNEEIKPENVRIHSRADELIACLEGEIAKRDARIVELEQQVIGMRLDVITQVDAHSVTRAELAALKAQEPVEYQLRALIRDVTNIPEAGYYMPQSWHDQVIALSLSGKLDAPVSEAKAQGVVMQASNFEASNGEYRNPGYEGQFDGETVEQAEARRHWATTATELATARITAAHRAKGVV